MKKKKPRAKQRQSEVYWFPSQLALILGTSQRDILKWIIDGELEAEVKGSMICIKESYVIDHLRRHPEHVGRLYCDDLPDAINHLRANIVDKLEAENDI